MAAKGFDQASCEDCHSSTNNLSYRVSVRQILCDDCAERKNDRILDNDEPVTLSCKHHDTVQARIFCRSHDVWLCHECAFNIHRPCEAIRISDEISKREEELSEILVRARARANELKMLAETTDQRMNLARDNFKAIRRQISTACKEEQKKVEDEETEKAAEITAEAEERIRRITEEKNKKLRLVTEKATCERQLIKEGNEKLQRSIDRVDRALQRRSNEINSCRLTATTALAHSIAAAEAMAVQERYQGNDFYQVASSLDDSIKADVNTSSIEQITFIGSEVSFCRRYGPILGEMYVSKEKWEMAYEFYPSIGQRFELKGSFNQDEVLLQDISSGKVNATSLKRQCICKDIETKNIERTFTCTSFHDKWIVCGTEDGTVVIYNTKWKPIRTINVTKHHQADILVSVERNGLILAAVKSESSVHVYNPDDGKLVRSIAVSDGRQIQEMHALSSGCIAVRTQCCEGPDVCVLQTSGTVQSTHHFHGKTVHSIAVDRVSDAIYVMSSDRGHLVIHVVQTQDESVTELTEIGMLLNPAWYYQTCVIPEAGTFVICHYGKVLVYKRVSTNQQLNEVLDSDKLFANALQSIYV